MMSGLHGVVDEIITKIRAGRLTRRSFLERAVAVGLSSSAAVSLLEACGGTSNSTGGNGQTVNINYLQGDNSGVFRTLVSKFNAQNNGVHVTINTNSPQTTDQVLTLLTTMLRARGSSIDVFPMDIIWPAEFGANGWTIPLDDKWPASERAKYLPGPIQGCTYQGKLWAAPYYTDAGLIYYRTDMIKTPPTTYDELVSMSKAAAPSKAKFGYLWQGAQYEGLVCDFVEVLYGHGGSVLDPNDAKKVTINSPEAVAALTLMTNWIGTISPQAVTTYKEEDSRSAWQDGDSVFMRNWPYAYSLGNDPTKSKIAGKYDVHPMLSSSSSTTGHSCLGGWQLGINAFSKEPDAAWKFVHFMLSLESQKALATVASLFATHKSIYSDPDVLAKVPFFGKMQPVLQAAQPRPVSPVYPDISDAIQQRVHEALTKQTTPAAALSQLQSDLQTIVNKA